MTQNKYIQKKKKTMATAMTTTRRRRRFVFSCMLSLDEFFRHCVLPLVDLFLLSPFKSFSIPRSVFTITAHVFLNPFLPLVSPGSSLSISHYPFA